MSADEQQIRDLIADWMSATQAGDVDKVLSFMTDDVVFHVTGQEPFGKQGWLDRSRPPSAGAPRPVFEGKSEILEIQLSGDYAYVRTRLEVTVTPPDRGSKLKRAGYTLSVLRKSGDRWQLARDANMLAPVHT